MKCPRCDFISFDYLDRCANCGRMLLGVRKDLNLSGLKPEVPFLLGSLIGDLQGDFASAQEPLKPSPGTELDFSGLKRKTLTPKLK